MVKRAQYKIQQMAFMILAIFFFFVLVGLFFVGWQITNLKMSASKLQEEKALSALKVIADSIELNCDESEDWCIDRDKLTAFSEYSNLYEGYWDIASIELLIVYPPRGERIVSSVGNNPDNGETSSGGCNVDHDNDGINDHYVASASQNLHLDANMGRLDHQAKKNEGNARPPLLVYENLVPGERIKFTNVAGEINYGILADSAVASCLKRSGDGGYGGAVGGFYTKEGHYILERALADFAGGDGVIVPKNADKLYVYVIESNDHRFDYMDNSGGCDFSVSKLSLEDCDIQEGNQNDLKGIDNFGSGLDNLNYGSEDSSVILCPAKDCDYYILYDSGQEDKQTYSAYVNVCETIDRSHQICELGKLMLGVKIRK